MNQRLYSKPEESRLFYYHCSPIKNRESILEQGLIPQAGERARRYEQYFRAVYLTNHLDKLMYLLKFPKWFTHPEFKDGFDIYEVAGDFEVRPDQKLSYGLYTKEKIKSVKLIETLENFGIKNRSHEVKREELIWKNGNLKITDLMISSRK